MSSSLNLSLSSTLAPVRRTSGVARGLLAMMALGSLAAACSKEETVFSSFYLEVTSDTPKDGKRITRIEAYFRNATGPKPEPFATGKGRDPNRVTIPTPTDDDPNPAPLPDLTTTAYRVKIVPSEAVKGKAYLVLLGLADGSDAPVAAWVGLVNLDQPGLVTARLAAPKAECDKDNDGLANCTVSGCCPAGTESLSDCNDQSALSSPVQRLPACVPCPPSGQADIDYDCDGKVDACVDADSDHFADCDKQKDCDPADPKVNGDAPELCNGKDDNCDGLTDTSQDPKYQAPVIADCDSASKAKADKGVCAGKAVPTCTNGAATCVYTQISQYQVTETLCDDLDNDCDGEKNEGLTGCGVVPSDWDGDKFTVADGDCNPYDARIYPGSTWPGCCRAEDVKDFDEQGKLFACDFDCDKKANLCAAGDTDGDGTADDFDCDPKSAQIYPGAPEKCGDSIDQNCNNIADAAEPGCKGWPTGGDGLDADNDGFPASVDCDENDKAVFPGQAEACNGKDDNCNKVVDEGNPGGGKRCINPAKPYGECRNLANQGWVVCAHGLLTAEDEYKKQTAGNVDVAIICVDYAKAPDAESRCDGKNEDCDCQTTPCDDLGTVDEDFVVQDIALDKNGQKKSLKKNDGCGVGACDGGTVVCHPKAATQGTDQQLTCSTWDKVSKEADGGGAALHFCDGIDNDCDGTVDGHSVGISMTTCFQDGECAKHLVDGAINAVCSEKTWVCGYQFDAFKSNVKSPEGAWKETVCDGLDNDCDAKVDDDLVWTNPETQQKVEFGKECTAIGGCGQKQTKDAVKGLVECSEKSAGLATCSTMPDGGQSLAVTETCNGVDDDCDGTVDNKDALTWIDPVTKIAIPREGDCDGVGECGTGKVICADDGTTATCSTNPNSPHKNASAGTAEATEYQQKGPKTELCNHKDDDCNGVIDDTTAIKLDGVIDLGKPCNGIGECGSGVVICSADGSFKATCSTDANSEYKNFPVDSAEYKQWQASGPKEEICDFKDNDCDSATDEGLTWLEPSSGAKVALGDSCVGVGECAKQAGVVAKGVVECTKGTGKTTCSTNSDGSQPRSQPEVCDGLDNDCDGETDEGQLWHDPESNLDVALKKPCNGIGACGVGGDGVVECNLATTKATCSTNADGSQKKDAPEVCNGADDDCDTEVDEGLSTATPGVTCKLVGVCTPQNVVATCVGGNWQCDYGGASAYEGTETTCDGLDNDCDNAVDEPADLKKSVTCTQSGVCAGLAPTCDGSLGWRCHPETIADYAAVEGSAAHCDGKDNDCDTLTDEVYTAAETQSGAKQVALSTACTRGNTPCLETGVVKCSTDKTKAECSVTGKAKDAACTDGKDTTFQDKCTGGEDSTCVGTTYVCSDDGLTCTTTKYDGAGGCSHVPNNGFCAIAAQCVADQTQNPSTPCQLCDAAKNPTGWTNRAVGTVCSDGAVCTSDDKCDASGACKGLGFNCDDGKNCTIDECNGSTCSPKTVNPGSCFIGSECYNAMQQHPTNPCKVCDPSKSQTDWTNKADNDPCSDNDKCTQSDSCQSGVCVGTNPNLCHAEDGLPDNECTTDTCTPTPDASQGDGCVHTPLNAVACTGDGLDCTTDTCKAGKCSHDIIAGNCSIDGKCYLAGVLNATNDCEACDASKPTAWTALVSQTPCNDKDLCSKADACNGSGKCVGTKMGAADCTDGLECTIDECPDKNGCTHTNKADGTGCSPDGVDCTIDQCKSGVCNYDTIIVSSCYIDHGTGIKTCVGLGASDPANQCKSCQPATDQAKYLNRASTEACNDNDGCTQGEKCNGSGACAGGAPPDCSPFNDDCNVGKCSSLGASTYNCIKDKKADDTLCTDEGKPCTTDICKAGQCTHPVTVGCLIQGSCIAENTLDPTSEQCRICKNSVDSAGYSPVSAGADCKDEDPSITCTADKCDGAGVCKHELKPNTCRISGVCYSEGTINSLNTCQSCQSLAKPTDWSNLPTDTTCALDSFSCTDDKCDNAGQCKHPIKSGFCLILGTCYPVGTTKDAAESCKVCAANKSDDWSNKPVDTLCTDDGNPCKLDKCDAVGVCQHPNALTSTTCVGDSNPCTDDHCDGNGACITPLLPENTPCDVDTFGCTSQKCSVAGTCGQTIDTGCLISIGGISACYASGAPDPQNPCMTCQPGTSKTAFSPAMDNTDCGTCGKCSAGTCVADLTQDLDCGSCMKCTGKGTCGMQSITEDEKNECDPTLDCGTGFCNGAGACSYNNVGTSCSDGSACTVSDTCDGAGHCTPGASKVCNAAPMCRTNAGATCNPADGVCAYPAVPDTTACDDANACTVTDTCTGGTCNGVGALPCASPPACKTVVGATCDAALGCVYPSVADGAHASCTDVSVCTTDTCAAGVCQHNAISCTTPPTCKSTTGATCDAALGCQYPNNVTNGAHASCNDSNACTTESCNNGTCATTFTVSCATPPNECHTAGTCNTTTGLCAYPKKADATACDAGNVCKTGKTCTAGVCGGGSNAASSVNCDDQDPCTKTDKCNGSGLCLGIYDTTKNGNNCDDKNPCTKTDKCNGTSLKCVGVTDAAATTCDDKNPCTKSDTCSAGVCGPGTSFTCPGSLCDPLPANGGICYTEP